MVISQCLFRLQTRISVISNVEQQAINPHTKRWYWLQIMKGLQPVLHGSISNNEPLQLTSCLQQCLYLCTEIPEFWRDTCSQSFKPKVLQYNSTLHFSNVTVTKQLAKQGHSNWLHLGKSPCVFCTRIPEFCRDTGSQSLKQNIMQYTSTVDFKWDCHWTMSSTPIEESIQLCSAALQKPVYQ
jgi:hypothetical protein